MFKIHSYDENATQDTEKKICFGTPLTVQQYQSTATTMKTDTFPFEWILSFFPIKSPRGEKNTTTKAITKR